MKKLLDKAPTFVLGMISMTLLFGLWSIKVGIHSYTDKQIVVMVELYDAMTQLEEYFEDLEYREELQKHKKESFDDKSI